MEKHVNLENGNLVLGLLYIQIQSVQLILINAQKEIFLAS